MNRKNKTGIQILMHKKWGKKKTNCHLSTGKNATLLTYLFFQLRYSHTEKIHRASVCLKLTERHKQ